MQRSIKHNKFICAPSSQARRFQSLDTGGNLTEFLLRRDGT